MSSIEAEYDCVVMGGGPAGSTAAAIVAKAGFSTLLLEREAMPREHIGESLMPETYWVFKRLGVLDKIDALGFCKKVGVQFVNSTGRESQPFFFRNHDPSVWSETWHVDRGKLDSLLFETAREHGATCCDRTRVTNVRLIENNGEKNTLTLQAVDGSTQKIDAKVVIDATGQQTMLANKLGTKEIRPELRKAAIWGHYQGASRDTSGGGVKTIILHTQSERSWFWYIPQADDLVSVGVVGDADYLLKNRGSVEQTFTEELADCPAVAERVGEAKRIDELIVGREFSYSNTRPAGNGWVTVGDAWGFIDPVYSSGVYFALKSAEMAADCIIEGLQKNDTSAEQLGKWIAEFSAGTQWIGRLVDAFYSGHFRVGKFIQKYPHHAGGLTDLLLGRMFKPGVGDIFDDLEPWLEARRQESE